MSETFFDLRAPTGEPIPLLVSVPHCGTEIPPALAKRLREAPGRVLPDTDWHLQRLYDFVPAMGGVLLTARYSRYVVDLNRDPEARPLYPGRFETGLLPTETFARQPLYLEGQEPEPGDSEEVHQRRDQYYRPYHQKLRDELDRLRARFGTVCLFEAHSIRGEVPALFEGRLPECVVGDAQARSCSPERSAAFRAALVAAGREVAHNTPFQGGYITRAYGQPEEGLHALQLEMPLANYLQSEAPPWTYDEPRAKILRAHLRVALEAYVVS